MAGSISLTGTAALRTGAGLVTQAVPDRILETVAVLNPNAMCLPLDDDAHGRIVDSAYAIIQSRYGSASSIACGPGLGRSLQLQQFVRKVVSEAPMVCVVDADGLNNLADSGGWPACVGARIITPHPKEWQRLSGVPSDQLEAQRLAAIRFAKLHSVTVVLKGHQTLVTDGTSAYLNMTGTPAMASAGSGDVLTGIITALCCQGLSARDAAHLAVYVHGLSGQLAQEKYSARVVVASQLVDFINAAILKSAHS